jgi:hypothetical protein
MRKFSRDEIRAYVQVIFVIMGGNRTFSASTKKLHAAAKADIAHGLPACPFQSCDVLV